MTDSVKRILQTLTHDELLKAVMLILSKPLSLTEHDIWELKQINEERMRRINLKIAERV